MAKNENKERFRDINEVRSFLRGINNRKNSKAFVNVEVIDGYYHLCVWLDNKLTPEEVVSTTFLEECNGFKKFYKKKMNKAEENCLLMETVQDITTIVWDAVKDNPDGTDSREIFSLCRSWAEEFERYWSSHIEQGVEDEHDYMLEVEEFADKKIKEYKAKEGGSDSTETQSANLDIVLDKMYEGAKQRVCMACPSHEQDCPYLIRNMQNDCPLLDDIMRGYEMSQEDTKKYLNSHNIFRMHSAPPKKNN